LVSAATEKAGTTEVITMAAHKPDLRANPETSRPLAAEGIIVIV
jgi:hypothetical protein